MATPRPGLRRPEELEQIAGEPLTIAELACIWRAISEEWRLGFIHALQPRLASSLIVRTFDDSKNIRRNQ